MAFSAGLGVLSSLLGGLEGGASSLKKFKDQEIAEMRKRNLENLKNQNLYDRQVDLLKAKEEIINEPKREHEMAKLREEYRLKAGLQQLKGGQVNLDRFKALAKNNKEAIDRYTKEYEKQFGDFQPGMAYKLPDGTTTKVPDLDTYLSSKLGRADYARLTDPYYIAEDLGLKTKAQELIQQYTQTRDPQLKSSITQINDVLLSRTKKPEEVAALKQISELTQTIEDPKLLQDSLKTYQELYRLRQDPFGQPLTWQEMSEERQKVMSDTLMNFMEKNKGIPEINSIGKFFVDSQLVPKQLVSDVVDMWKPEKPNKYDDLATDVGPKDLDQIPADLYHMTPEPVVPIPEAPPEQPPITPGRQRAPVANYDDPDYWLNRLKQQR